MYLVRENIGIITVPLLRGGGAGKCYGRGVFADMQTNTPLHPSQEGNRTAQALNLTLFHIFQLLNTGLS